MINQRLLSLLGSTVVAASCKVRLVGLYAIRYGSLPNNYLVDLRASLLSDPRCQRESEGWQIIADILRFHTSLSKDCQFFNTAANSSGATSHFLAKRPNFMGAKGVENIFTQHSPRLERVMQDLLRGRLRDVDFPHLQEDTATQSKPQDIIIFMVGGATYEEAKVIAQLNLAHPAIRILLGSTSIHNSETFLLDVKHAVRSWNTSADVKVN